VDRSRAVPIGPFPSGVTAHRNAGGADDLIRGHVEVHQEGGELPVKLAGRIEWMFLPAVAVVYHHLGIPLGKVEAAALSALAPGHGGWPSVPLEVYRDRIAGRERLGQSKS